VLAWSVKQQQLKIEKRIIFQVFFQGTIGGDVLERGLTGKNPQALQGLSGWLLWVVSRVWLSSFSLG
jgi:hypothetical protein